LLLGEEIGRGFFGVVLKAKYGKQNETDGWGKVMKVAVKKPQCVVTYHDLEIFLKEMRILAHVGSHKYIVSFVGAVVKGLKRSKNSIFP